MPKKTPAHTPLSNAERQSRFRARRRQELEALHRALRNDKATPDPGPLRNARRVDPRTIAVPPAWTAETIDDALTELRHAYERVDAQCAALLKQPGLTDPEITTLRHRRFTEARKYFERLVAQTPRRAQARARIKPTTRR